MHKDEARKKYKALRHIMTHDEADARSKAIARQFIDSGIWKQASVMHVFLSMPGKTEVDTKYIIHYFQANHPEIKLCTSMVQEEDGQLLHTYIDSTTAYTLNKWSIPEPEIIIPLTESEIDLVIVPLLAFDTKGNRVGYGKGYYDRFLAKCKKDVLKIGISLFEPEKDEIEADDWDVKLTHGITAEHIHHVNCK